MYFAHLCTISFDAFEVISVLFEILTMISRVRRPCMQMPQVSACNFLSDLHWFVVLIPLTSVGYYPMEQSCSIDKSSKINQ